MKGPNGSWLFIVWVRKARKTTPAAPPNQKEKRKAERDPGKPRIREVAKINLASPRPIILPLEKNQIEAIKRAINALAAKSFPAGIGPRLYHLVKIVKKPSRRRVKTAPLGIILKRRSDIATTIAAASPASAKARKTKSYGLEAGPFFKKSQTAAA